MLTGLPGLRDARRCSELDTVGPRLRVRPWPISIWGSAGDVGCVHSLSQVAGEEGTGGLSARKISSFMQQRLQHHLAPYPIFSPRFFPACLSLGPSEKTSCPGTQNMCLTVSAAVMLCDHNADVMLNEYTGCVLGTPAYGACQEL